MKTIKSEFVGTDAREKDWWRCVIVSEKMPESLPETGEDIDGIADNAGIAAGSLLITPDGNQIYYTDAFAKPFGGSGVIGLSISPNLTLTPSLSSVLPIEATEDYDRKEFYLSGEYVDGEEYRVYVTPTSDLVVTYYDGEIHYGQKGESVGVPVFIESGYAWTEFYVQDSDDNEEVSKGVEVMIEITYKDPDDDGDNGNIAD